MVTGKESRGQEVNLEAAASLVAALERDLQKVSGDSRDIQRLRDEVETLKNNQEPKSSLTLVPFNRITLNTGQWKLQ